MIGRVSCAGGFLFIAACAHPAPPSTGGAIVVLPASSATAPRASSAPSAPSAASSGAMRNAPVPVAFETAKTAWVNQLTRTQTFSVVTFSSATDPLVIEWIVHPLRPLPNALPEDADRPWSKVAPLTLRLRQGTVDKAITLGEGSGSPEGVFLSMCKRRGYRPPVDLHWEMPALASLVSSFWIATQSGGPEFIVLAGEHGTFHVLGRLSGEGVCTPFMQGPLDACRETLWERYGEIRTSVAHAATENMYFASTEGRLTPIDCIRGDESPSGRLRAP